MYAACFGALQRYCYFKLPSRADGDDVLQQVALAAWLRRDSLRNAEAFKSWLLQIAANQVRDFYRRRAKQLEIPLDELNEATLTDSRFGVTIEEAVRETLDTLGGSDKAILTLAYLHNMPQADIATRLGIPLGTVKSRLYTARRRFRNEYPHLQTKGEITMFKLPKIMPGYTIAPTEQVPFACKWEELMGWFIVPKLEEKLTWAMYEMPGRAIYGEYQMKITGRAAVHGIEGVAVRGDIKDEREECSVREFIAQLTDTHVRFLAESHMRGDVKLHFTFLDGDAFLDNWGFGESNCGSDIYPKRRGVIKRDGSAITCPAEKFVIDVIDRCAVMIAGKEYDTIRIMDIECYNSGVASEQFIDQNGRTVLWRRFNRDDWKIEHYGQKWSEKLPGNERLSINGETYVHWYDCISDYVIS